MNVTQKNNVNSKPLIISDGCCIQYGDSSALDDVTFSINEGKNPVIVDYSKVNSIIHEILCSKGNCAIF